MTQIALSITLAELSDASAITDLINLAFSVESFFIDGDRIDLDEVQSKFTTGDFLVARDSSGIAGVVYVEVSDERGYFGLLSVDPVRQGTGLGRLLVEAAEQHAAAAGCKFMDMCIVNLRTELPAFYHRLGYVETDTSPFPEHASPKQPCHFVNMRRPLV